MKSQRFPGIDYDFRPISYGDATDILQTILKNVKGTLRRQMITDYWTAGKLDELSNLHLLESLDDEQRQRLSLIHPTFMGGEYLPEYRHDEVEIARVELESTTADVISVRAFPNECRITYSVVDEYETEFQVSPQNSEQPLTLRELVDLMDSALDGESLGLVYTHANYEADEPSVDRLDHLRTFTSVSSDFYPQLSSHYEQVTNAWYVEEKRKISPPFNR